jgi:hypothetical protein
MSGSGVRRPMFHASGVRPATTIVCAAGMIVGCSLLIATPAMSSRQPSHESSVRGTWTNPLGSCVAHITRFDPATGDLSCTGTSAWTGTWRGATTWTVTGNQNPTTGAGSGRIDEVFIGRAAHGRSGSLTFVEHFTLDATGKIAIHGRIVKGTGGFKGSRGTASWIGTSSATDGSGSGTYRGRWRPPHRRHHKHHR